MQKKIIALAVAGLVSGAAFAQTNVTVYGVADACIGYSSSGTNELDLGIAGTNSGKMMGVGSGCWSGSRIGFKGEEALGNGLKAVFTLEYGTDIDANASGWSQIRQSFVGLAGNFGTVSLGRQYAPSGMFLGATSVNDITTVNPSNYMVPAFLTMQTGGGSRWNNSVAYHSPNWSGFDFRAIYGFGEQYTHPDHSIDDRGRYGLGVRYANGPVYVTAMYQAVTDDDALNLGGNKAWTIGGSYNFKVVKVFANYIEEKIDLPSSDEKKQYWSLGLGIPVGAVGQVNFEYGDYRVKDIDDVKSRGFGIGYQHDMSKRTRLYATVSRINNKDFAAFGGLAGNGLGSGTSLGTSGGTSQFGENNTNFVMGIRHLF